MWHPFGYLKIKTTMLETNKFNSNKNFQQFGIKKINKLYNQLGLNTRVNSIFVKSRQKNKMVFFINKNLIGKNLKTSIYEHQKFKDKIKLINEKK